MTARFFLPLVLLPAIGFAQSSLIISDFTPNGLLTWSNAVPNSTCRVEWASRPAGPWTNTWNHLSAIPTGTNTQLSAYVPMFYRVVMTLPQTYTISWCNLQWPVSASMPAGQLLTVYGQVYIPGLTDQTAGNDLAANVVAEFGYGPHATDPAGNTSWTWTRGQPNGAYSQANNNDEYMGAFAVSQPGTYDFAVRFSGDGGSNWVYTDSSGSADGYQISNAGHLEVTAP